MTLEYNIDARLNALIPVLEEYSSWFLQAVNRIFYPTVYEVSVSFTSPRSFIVWLEQELESGMDESLIQNLEHLHRDLITQAELLIAKARETSAPPEHKEFQSLTKLYDEFIHHVRRLEIDLHLENSGIDLASGLRSAALLEKDIAVEMDRLSRQGKPFCLALVKINHMEDIVQNLGRDVAHSYVRLVADLIKGTIRSFDDAYRIEEGLFALSLKQADMNGGVKALERMKRALEARGASYNINGESRPLSLVSCIAEPSPEDNIKQLIANLRDDLKTVLGGEATVLEYLEMSPLQRFAQESGE